MRTSSRTAPRFRQASDSPTASAWSLRGSFPKSAKRSRHRIHPRRSPRFSAAITSASRSRSGAEPSPGGSHVSRTVVVGGGVIGLACAYALRKQGEDVTVLDSAEPGAGCSRGTAGWIVPTLAEPLPTPGLTWRSMLWLLRRDSPLHIDPRAALGLAPWLWTFWRHCNAEDFRSGRRAWEIIANDVMQSFDALVADGVRFEMHSAGLLFVFLREAAMRAMLHEAGASSAAHGSEPRVFTGSELREFEPSVSGAVTTGLWVEQERHVRPETLCAGLAQWLTTHGVEIRAGT